MHTTTTTFTIHPDSRTTEHSKTLRRGGIMLGSYDYSPINNDWFATVYLNGEPHHNWSLPTEQAAHEFVLCQRGIPADTTFVAGEDEAVLYERSASIGQSSRPVGPELNEHDETRAEGIRQGLGMLRDAGIDDLELLQALRAIRPLMVHRTNGADQALIDFLIEEQRIRRGGTPRRAHH